MTYAEHQAIKRWHEQYRRAAKRLTHGTIREEITVHEDADRTGAFIEVVVWIPREAAEKERRMTGTIKKLIKDKRIGFITGEDKKDYFFHESALKNGAYPELEVGQEVTFEDSEGTKGPRAEDVYV